MERSLNQRSCAAYAGSNPLAMPRKAARAYTLRTVEERHVESLNEGYIVKSIF
jgi:hypothetical protein